MHTWCGLSEDLGCRSETCCTRLAANTGRTKSPFGHHRTTLSGCVFAAKACVDNRKTIMVNIDTSSTCSHNMANFGLVTAEICWRVWGTPANFIGFGVLAALLQGTLVSGRKPNFAALNRGRHLYSTGRPSRWALAHISSFPCCPRNTQNLSQSFHLKGLKTCFFILPECPAFTAVHGYRPH